MKVRIVQGKPTIGNVELNLAKILSEMEVAFKENADFIAFPELFLTGYPLEDRIFLEDLKVQVKLGIKKILKISLNFENLHILLPTPLFQKSVFNAVLLIKNGKILQTIKKLCLPNYGVFDEKRYFQIGTKPQIFKFKNEKILISICEEIWNENYIKLAKKLKPDFIFSINASPFEVGKFQKRIEKASNLNAKIIYVNQVLGYDEIIFDGRSFAVSEAGEMLLELPAFEEISCSFNFSKTKILPALYNLDLLYKALVFGLSEYISKNGFKGILLGLSGGIDSALCAKIALDAVGSENVLPVFLPSKISSNESKKDALEFIKLNSLTAKEIPISEIILEFHKSLGNLSGLSNQNLQSRIRGNILMALSNETRKMLITTGNKSELAVGYCTIYGDMNGGFNPIKDLFKTQIFELCHFLNTKEKVFPTNMLQKAPTAELEAGQTDETSFGMPYLALDFILKFIIEEKISTKELENLASQNILNEVNKFRKANKMSTLTAKETVKKVQTMLQKAQFKREQAVVGTKISTVSFGRDWRFGTTF
jgi:NAD+ synthase (glutamine-hydrolysing)